MAWYGWIYLVLFLAFGAYVTKLSFKVNDKGEGGPLEGVKALAYYIGLTIGFLGFAYGVIPAKLGIVFPVIGIATFAFELWTIFDEWRDTKKEMAALEARNAAAAAAAPADTEQELEEDDGESGDDGDDGNDGDDVDLDAKHGYVSAAEQAEVGRAIMGVLTGKGSPQDFEKNLAVAEAGLAKMNGQTADAEEKPPADSADEDTPGTVMFGFILARIFTTPAAVLGLIAALQVLS